MANDSYQIAHSKKIMEEVVTFTFDVLQDSASNHPHERIDTSPIYLLALHMAEMTDGARILISEACPIPAGPLVRSAFDALLTMEYISQSDTERRARAWMVGIIHNQLDYHELHDPNHRFNDHLQALSSDKYASPYDPPVPGVSLEQFRQAEKSLRNLLQSEWLMDAESEYQKQLQKIKQKGRRPAWHQLYGGPPNLRQMAIQVGLKATYDDFYQSYSSLGHAQNVSRFLQKGETGGLNAVLRDTKSLASVTRYAAIFMHHGLRVLTQHMQSPNYDVKDWYFRKLEPMLTSQTSIND